MKISFAPGRAWCVASAGAIAVLEPNVATGELIRVHELLERAADASALAASIREIEAVLAAVVVERRTNALMRSGSVPAVLDGTRIPLGGSGYAAALSPELIDGQTLELGEIDALRQTTLPFEGGVTRVCALRVRFDDSRIPGVVAPAADIEAAETDEVPVFPNPSSEGQPALVLQSGERIPLDQGVLIGRRPQSERADGARPPRLVSVGGLSMVISRTHLRVELTQEGVMATDLGSTNGTTVSRPGTLTQRLRAGVPTRLHAGDILGLGDGVAIALSDDLGPADRSRQKSGALRDSRTEP